MKITSYLSNLILLLVLLSFSNCTSNTSSESTTENPTPSPEVTDPQKSFTKQTISPPFEGIDTPFRQYALKSNQPKTIKLENGTKISIPANAFISKSGTPIKGEVAIKYREFHTTGDIIASGIPMQWEDETGNLQYMQSAGMFELRAYAQGEEVALAKDKRIKVDMASYVSDDQKDGFAYNFWNYDEKNNQWKDLGATKASSNPTKEQAKKDLAAVEKTLASQAKPQAPVKFEKTKPILNLDINVEAFPELKEMKQVLWQYAGDNPKEEDPQLNPWVLETPWDYAELEPTERFNLYKLTLKNKLKTFNTKICVDRQGKNFDDAMASYQENLKTYQENEVSAKQYEDLVNQQADLLRSFELSEMGIHNYDLLIKQEDPIPVLADFDFNVKIPNIDKFAKVYLILDDRNVVRFPKEDWDRFQVTFNRKNTLVAILPNNKVAYFTHEDFERERNKIELARNKPYTFKLKVKEVAIRNVADINKLIDRLA